VTRRFLLDSHALIFAATEPERLGSEARRLVENEHNHIYVSAVTVWELLLKARKGKIDFGPDPAEELQSYCRTLRVEMLPVIVQHAYAAMKLDPIHKDPFDRMLVAQAKFEGLTLVTKDRNIPGHEVETVW
jgi:PIN domain nuclease of toxin-antitoxin system